MDKSVVNELRRTNAVPFRVVYWLEALAPILEHDDFGIMYKGYVLAEDSFGKFSAIIGTTDKLLGTPLDVVPNGTPYKILKVEDSVAATA
jgi:hypothetical protein